MCGIQCPACRDSLHLLLAELRGELTQLEDLLWEYAIRKPTGRAGNGIVTFGPFYRSSAARELKDVLTELIQCKEQTICQIESLLEASHETDVVS